MKRIKTSMLAVVILAGAVLMIGCGASADEALNKYLDAQKAHDAKSQVNMLRDSDKEKAKAAIEERMEAEKKAGAGLKSWEITESKSDSSNAIIKVSAKRVIDGKEVTGEEQYVLEKENGEWRIDHSTTSFLLSVVDYK